jgi:hypothetical protein
MYFMEIEKPGIEQAIDEKWEQNKSWMKNGSPAHFQTAASQ